MGLRGGLDICGKRKIFLATAVIRNPDRSECSLARFLGNPTESYDPSFRRQ